MGSGYVLTGSGRPSWKHQLVLISASLNLFAVRNSCNMVYGNDFMKNGDVLRISVSDDAKDKGSPGRTATLNVGSDRIDVFGHRIM